MVVILKGGPHSHEHLKFDDQPKRILVQTNERSSGMYSRKGNRVSVYQRTSKMVDGCQVFAFARKKRGVVKNQQLIEAKYA